MKVASLLEKRRRNWLELEKLSSQMENRRKRALGGPAIARFASLYRAACADLSLADAYQLPPNTVNYLHQLVARAHNQLYHSRSFRVSNWGYEMLFAVPRRLYHDNYLRLAFVLFWGFFLGSMYLAHTSPEFCETLVGKESLEQMAEMHSESVSGANPATHSGMVGFYIMNNAGIGLQCFAYGLLGGIGGMMMLMRNAIFLGTIFGFMTTVDKEIQDNFFNFVTAHGPFELTAVVLAAAAGMRLGFAMIATGGLTRSASLRKATHEAMPTMCGFVILFCLAALIEGLLSPSTIPWAFKATVAVVSSGMLLFYFVILGAPRGGKRAA